MPLISEENHLVVAKLTNDFIRLQLLTIVLSCLLLLLISKATFAEVFTGVSAGNVQRSEEVWQKALKLNGLFLVKPNELPQIIFFIDSNCPACAHLWQAFNASAYKVSSAWIPVSHIHQDTGTGKAIALLRSADVLYALNKNYQSFDTVNKQGNIPAVDRPTQDELISIKNNTFFWKKLFAATPLILYRTPNGVWQNIGLSKSQGIDYILRQLAPAKTSDYGLKQYQLTE